MLTCKQSSDLEGAVRSSKRTSKDGEVFEQKRSIACNMTWVNLDPKGYHVIPKSEEFRACPREIFVVLGVTCWRNGWWMSPTLTVVLGGKLTPTHPVFGRLDASQRTRLAQFLLLFYDQMPCDILLGQWVPGCYSVAWSFVVVQVGGEAEKLQYLD